MIEGTVKDIKNLERVMLPDAELLKDTSNSSKAHIKLYKKKGNPSWVTLRFFYDLRANKATLKIKDYYPCLAGICTFTLIQTFMLMRESIINLIEAL